MMVLMVIEDEYTAWYDDGTMMMVLMVVDDGTNGY